MMYEYFFHIIDKESNEEYNFNGFFNDHFECDDFIKENKKVGNIVTIVYPYYQEIDKNRVSC